jgi:hypothetical protein
MVTPCTPALVGLQERYVSLPKIRKLLQQMYNGMEQRFMQIPAVMGINFGK